MSLFSQACTPVFDSNGLLPQHIAIIMDGNRRWAKSRGLPILEGHRRGVKALRATVEAMGELGIYYLTVFAFSTENNNRSEEEVSGLMKLILLTLKKELAEMHSRGIRLRFIGLHHNLPQEIKEMIEYSENLTSTNTRFYLTIALNYGGQQDITTATRQLAKKYKEDLIELEDINPETITQHLSTSFLPAPDILIRTSGEQRISNFLLWELSYAEFFFVQTLWPDFDSLTLQQILTEYQGRNRRYGR